MTREEGLPRRPWFKHYVYAPGFYTGYEVKTLPAVREAIEEKQYSDVAENVRKTAEAIETLAARVREAAAVFEPPDYEGAVILRSDSNTCHSQERSLSFSGAKRRRICSLIGRSRSFASLRMTWDCFPASRRRSRSTRTSRGRRPRCRRSGR